MVGRGITVSAILFTVLVLEPAIRVFAQEGPTDFDLKAGYCLNILQSEITNFQICQRVPSFPDLDKEREASCLEHQNNVQRLKDYLGARGYLFGTRDPTPVMIAGSRGDADLKDCIEFAKHPTPESSACMNRCMKKLAQSKDPSNDKDFVPCANSCPTASSCARMRVCSELSFLPF